jgi:hypothetical protein
MEFIIGYDLQKSGFRLNEFRKDFILTSNIDEFDTREEEIIKANPSHLIVLRENQEIVGWAIWHESSTREHQKGSSRDNSDIDILEKLFGRTKEIIELHELWIKKKHRS